jgi:hypothetical protein
MDAEFKRLREAHLITLDGLVIPDEIDLSFPDKTDYPHLKSMIEVMRATPDMPIDKMARWCGFIHGVLACRRVISVDAERDRTRPIFTGKA